MTIKECEEKIKELEESVSAHTAWAKDYQEHAGAMLCAVSEMKAELAALKEQLNQLKAEEAATDVWPKDGDAYWIVCVDGMVQTQQHCKDSFDLLYKKGCLSIGNCFRTREEAEFAVERLKVLAEMRKFAFEPDWPNKTQEKWVIYYNYAPTSIEFAAQRRHDTGAPVYFGTKKRAEECVAAIGEERIKKYYFGVKDNA